MRFLTPFGLTLIAAVALLLSGGPLHADEGHDHHHHDHAHEHAHADGDEADSDETPITGDAYPLDTCIVAPNSKLGSMGDPIVYNHEGREVRFCCAGCIGAFERNPEPFLEAADKKIAEQQAETYPATKCPVSGMALGSMGDAVSIVHNNRLVKFCCAPCSDPFKSDPERYLKKLDEEIAELQRDSYPLDTCLVMEGEPLDAMGGAVEFVHANQLVRLCCPGCKREFKADPPAFMAKLAEARAAASDE